MGKKFENCIGSVTVLTDDLVIYQGTIKHGDRHHDDEPPKVKVEVEDEEEFILVTLECVPVIVSLTGAALHFVIFPISKVGDTVQVNLDEIISISPNSTGCLGGTP